MMFCSGTPNSPKAFIRCSTALSPNISRRSFNPRSPSSCVSIRPSSAKTLALNSSPLPDRLALLDEGPYANPKILAAVAAAHEVVTVWQSRVEQTSDCFLADPHGDRGVAGEPLAKLHNAAV